MKRKILVACFALISLGISLCVGTASKTKTIETAALGRVFTINGQDMFSNPTFNGTTGTATLTSGDRYTLTLNNFTFTGYKTNGTGTVSSVIYVDNLDKPLSIELIGTNRIENNAPTSIQNGQNRAISIALNSSISSDVNYIRTATSASSNASLTLITPSRNAINGVSEPLFISSPVRTVVYNCTLSCQAGGDGKCYGIHVDGDLFVGSNTTLGGYCTMCLYSEYNVCSGAGIYANIFNVDGGSITASASLNSTVNMAAGIYCSRYYQYGGSVNAFFNGGASSSTNTINAGIITTGYLTVNKGELTARGGASTSNKSYGVYSPSSGNCLELNNDAGKVELSGNTSATNIIVRNVMKGVYFTTTSTSATPSGAFLAYPSGTTLFNTYKRVIFQEIKFTFTQAAYSLEYDGNAHEPYSITVTSPTSGYTISYRLDSESDFSTTMPTFTDVGTYTVHYKIEATNYPTVMSYATFKIIKAYISFDAPTLASDLTYDGSSHYLVTSEDVPEHGTLYYKVDDGEWSTARPSATDAGEYHVYYKVDGGDNFYNITSREIGVVTISKADLTNVSVAQTSPLTYTGDGLVAIVSTSGTSVNNQFIDYRYSLDPDCTWDSAFAFVPELTEAGSHTVYYIAHADNHTDYKDSFTVTINKANASFVAPIGQTGLRYTGNPLDLLSSLGSSADGTFEYKVGSSGSYSTSMPKATYPGTYTVYYRVVGDSNHNDVSESSLDVTISNAQLQNVNISNGLVETTYHGFKFAPYLEQNATSVDGSPVYFDCSETVDGEYNIIPKVEDAGTYTFYFVASCMYHDDAYGSFDIVVHKAESFYVFEPAPFNHDLNYEANPIPLIKSGTCNTGTIVYRLGTEGEFSTEVPTAIEPGDYTVYYKIIGDANHEDSEVSSVIATIQDGYIQQNFLTPYPLYYNGQPQTPYVYSKFTTVDGSPTTISYSLEEDGEYGDMPSLTEVGEYTIYYKVTAPKHYDFYGYFTETVNKGSPTILKDDRAQPINPTYTGEPQELITPAVSLQGEVQYSFEYSGPYSTSIPTATLPGEYKIYYKVIGNDNYNDSVAYSLWCNILPATITNVNVSQVGSIIADGTAKTPTVSTTATTVDGSTATFTYSDELEGTYTTSLPSFTTVGFHTVYYKVNAPYHNEETGSFVVTFSKGESSYISVPNAVPNLVYTGAAQELVTPGLTNDGTVLYRLGETGDYSSSIPTATLPGEYTIYFKIQGDEYHNNSGVARVVATISNATLTNVNVSQTGTLTYNGSSQNASVSASATSVNSQEVTFTYSLEEDGVYSTSIPSFTNAGTYTVYYKVNAPYHDEATGSFEITIEKANSSFTVRPTIGDALWYTGYEQQLLIAGSSDTGTVVYKLSGGEYSTEVPVGTDAKNYIIYFKIIGDENHKDSSELYSIRDIIKAQIVYDVHEEGQLVFNGSNQQPTLIVDVTTVDGSSYEIQYSTDGTNFSNDIPTLYEAGQHTIYYQITAQNHETVLGELEVFVDYADSSYEESPSAISGLTYTGNAQALINEGSTEDGTIMYKLDDGSYSSTVPTATQPGTYTVTYMILGDENHNNSSEESVVVTISNASLTGVNVSQDGSLTYSGSSQSPSVNETATTVDGSSITFTYSTEEFGEYNAALPGFTDAGTYTIYYHAQADNHDVYSGSFTVTINKADSSFTSSPAAIEDLVYTGSSQTLVSAGTSDSGTVVYSLVEDGEYSSTIPSGTNAGTYVVYYKIIGDSNHNDSIIYSETVIISKANVSFVTAPSGNSDLHYSGESQTLVQPGTSSAGEIQYKVGEDGVYSSELPTGKDVGEYTVYYKIVGGDNFNDSEESTLIVKILANDKTELSEAVASAEAYLESVKDDYPDITAELEQIIEDAKACLEDDNKTATQIETIVKSLKDEVSETQVEVVEQIISNIGEVDTSQECKDNIEAAQDAFNSLSEEQQAQVNNAEELKEAQDKYDELIKELENKPELIEENQKEISDDEILLFVAAFFALIGLLALIFGSFVSRQNRWNDRYY